MTPKQRMLNAYRGMFSDKVPVAPEFWCYYPAKVLGVDMIQFSREVPFHQALKATFLQFGCEGWGNMRCRIPNDRVKSRTTEKWLDADTLETRTVTTTPAGELTSRGLHSRAEPSWRLERPIKDVKRDLPAWEIDSFGGDPEQADCSRLVKAWQEVGETFLLEAVLGGPFFDFYAGARDGGFQAGVLDFFDPELEPTLRRLQEKYMARLVTLARVICERTPFESLGIGCSWSCNSLLGPKLWRQWDKPVIQAVAQEVHRHGRLLHVHFHGKCMDTVSDFAEIGIDCVCPFERPPGGDVAGAEGLRTVARRLGGRTTMNGNVHTVETLIRGKEEDVRREAREILEAFCGNPRVIVGTGDQVGRETPEKNLYALIDEVRKWNPSPS
ncbi:MAG: hypothetical protein NTW86_08615 [Candidatus Sumerlaeota bacterium]|nr:hypothetical protein [Candidatus Sumerlaeota bacterium]